MRERYRDAREAVGRALQDWGDADYKGLRSGLEQAVRLLEDAPHLMGRASKRVIKAVEILGMGGRNSDRDGRALYALAQVASKRARNPEARNHLARARVFIASATIPEAPSHVAAPHLKATLRSIRAAQEATRKGDAEATKSILVVAERARNIYDRLSRSEDVSPEALTPLVDALTVAADNAGSDNGYLTVEIIRSLLKKAQDLFGEMGGKPVPGDKLNELFSTLAQVEVMSKLARTRQAVRSSRRVSSGRNGQ